MYVQRVFVILLILEIVMRFIFSVVFFLLFSFPCFASMGLGDYGPEVLSVQKQLAVKGFFVGALDGRFGPVLENTVRCFQHENNLPMTGELDKDTYFLLMEKELPSRFSVQGNITKVRRIISLALGLRGVPYVFGGVSPAGFDCSGFVQYLFGSSGILVPRLADAQYEASARVDVPRMGDLVFFETYLPGVSHVGISLGGRDFIHASCGKGVTVSSLDDGYWSCRYVGAGRVFMD